MPERPNSLPKVAPAILPRICVRAGWTQSELLRAVDHGMRLRGNFNSLTATIPDGIAALPADMPVFDVRRTDRGWAVVVRLGDEWVRCIGGGTARFEARMILPAAGMIASRGKPIAELLEHSLLDSPDFVIVSADLDASGSRTAFVFAMPDCEFPT